MIGRLFFWSASQPASKPVYERVNKLHPARDHIHETACLAKSDVITEN